MSELISDCLTAKAAAGRRAVYVKSLKHYLERFARNYGCAPVHAIRAKDVEDYLAIYQGHSRATHLNRISSLFAFAVKRGLIPGNPCDQIERIRIDTPAPRILTPEEARSLYAACPQVCRPFLVLCLYAGLRPEEARKLDWQDISLPLKQVTVGAAHSKVRRRRVVPLCEKAIRLLEQHPLLTGPVAPSLSTLRRWKRKARHQIGGKWPADILRHTFASYALALHQDAGKVATGMGTSVTMLRRHYDGLASASAAQQFFA